MAYLKVLNMVETAAAAGLLDPTIPCERLNKWQQDAEHSLLEQLDEVERVKAEDFLARARAAAKTHWDNLAGAGGHGKPRVPRADATYMGADEHAPRMPMDEASLDGPEEDAGSGFSPQHLQRELCKLQDCTRLRHLEETLRKQGNWAQLERLRELRHPEVSHRWLWHLDSKRGGVLPQCDYILNVQKRLGARILNDQVECKICGACLDPSLEHSEVCAIAEATKGHYACVRAVVEGLKVADPGLKTEPRGLTNTQARPADIFTNAAVPGRCAALDVCITSLNAGGAGNDAAEP